MPKKRRDPMNLWLRGRSFYWECRWKGVRYGPKSLGPVSKDVAQRMAAEMRLAIIEGRYHERAVPTFGVFAAEFLRWYVVGRRPASIRHCEGILQRLVVLWDATPLDQVTTLMVERFRRDRAATRKPATVNGDLQVIRQLFRQAVAWDVVRENPAKGVRKVRENERPRLVLSDEEELRLLAECGAHLRPLVLFALHTGLRQAELTTLTWGQVDLIAGTVTVESGLAKSRKARTIPLNRVARECLPSPSERGGRVFGYRFWSSAFKLAVTRARLKGITPHSLRRTFGTRAIEKGVNVFTVQKWLGHSHVNQTMSYVHPSQAHEREAIELIGKARHG